MAVPVLLVVEGHDDERGWAADGLVGVESADGVVGVRVVVAVLVSGDEAADDALLDEGVEEELVADGEGGERAVGDGEEVAVSLGAELGEEFERLGGDGLAGDVEGDDVGEPLVGGEECEDVGGLVSAAPFGVSGCVEEGESGGGQGQGIGYLVKAVLMLGATLLCFVFCLRCLRPTVFRYANQIVLCLLLILLHLGLATGCYFWMRSAGMESTIHFLTLVPLCLVPALATCLLGARVSVCLVVSAP